MFQAAFQHSGRALSSDSFDIILYQYLGSVNIVCSCLTIARLSIRGVLLFVIHRLFDDPSG